jgi:predicted O-methyltransferase YrrM
VDQAGENAWTMLVRIDNTLPDVLIKRQPVDYVFIDGHHDEHATLAYFEQILPFLAETALLIFDDIKWSEGMNAAWDRISRDPRVGATVDLGPVGLCLFERSMTGHKYVSIPLP